MIERFQTSVLKDVEPEPSWPQMCNDPLVFMQEIAKRLFVAIDLNKISQNIIISQNIPRPEDRSKLWIKTSFPYGIGFIANGEYQMDYSFSGFPTNIPFLHRPFSPVPAHVTQIGDVLLKKYGMEDLNTKQGSDRMLWYIFEPPKIVI